MNGLEAIWLQVKFPNNNNNNAVLGHYTMSQCPYKFTDIEK